MDRKATLEYINLLLSHLEPENLEAVQILAEKRFSRDVLEFNKSIAVRIVEMRTSMDERLAARRLKLKGG